MKLTGWILIVLLLGSACVTLVYGLAKADNTVAQPIAFNHAVHTEDAGLACTDCHTNAASGIYAGLPGKQICLDCHDVDEEKGAHPEKDALFHYEERDGDIPWVRVALTAPDVYFSHRRHVSSAKLDCLDCHVDQLKLDKPPARARLVMRMEDCIDCHEESSVSTDCLACHR